MAEHTHGDMNVRDHEKTFAGFVRMVTWMTILILAVLVFLALANA
ncbi:aa3 type cytochrome c oxidase subunit IV [Defluviimonas denitrificans]|jgi:Ni,Fe-hydrogenase I cytochrome b subunit|uniref:Aa3 type cytochrome c oxidase subunit IV n=1 Tax=Albidovulum denitrificans TaxID=404881 RepID=A0A2S8S4J7_9RHOB|nr:aa3-type cytochrome c oxidase subunit IV [Defluviimonas denitrificans]PQV55726.1 aa3 type cytochrome c oxidase subunit IV [Defluviimonas denitrificans]